MNGPMNIARLAISSTLGVLVFVAGVTHCPRAAGAKATDSGKPGRILIVRGALNVFSLGLDKLACRLSQRGYQVDVAPPMLAMNAAAAIAREYHGHAPLAVVGHSRGGKYCSLVPELWQEKGIPVALVVILDANVQQPVPGNVQRCVNFYVTHQLSVLHGHAVRAADRRTDLVNVNLADRSRSAAMPVVGHFNIDESPWVQQLILQEVRRSLASPPVALPRR